MQSVVADDQNSLWVVDPAAPLLITVGRGGAKLVRIDLATNRVTRIYNFGVDVVKPQSYLNDVRVDTKRNTAYLTDSGAGAIVVVDLNTGRAHRALDGHPSVTPKQNVNINVSGKPVMGPTGKPPQIASDSIALSHDGEYLYYKSLTGVTLYRVKTSALRESGAESAKGGYREKIAQDPRLEWPDTFSEGPDGAIYITASHINDAPQYNHGRSTRAKPYTVFKFTP